MQLAYLAKPPKAYLRGKRYENEKRIVGGDKKSDEYKKSKSQNGVLISNTSRFLADEYGEVRLNLQPMFIWGVKKLTAENSAAKS